MQHEIDFIDYLNGRLLFVCRFPEENVNESLVGLYDELSRMRGDPAGQRDIINDYARFCISSFALEVNMGRGDLSEMHRWIVRSLTDDYRGDQKEDIYPVKVDGFIQDAVISNSPRFLEVLIRWLSGLYYYCRTRAALPDLAGDFSPLPLVIIKKIGKGDLDESHAFLLSQLMGWLAQNDKPLGKEATDLCEEIEQDPSVQDRARAVCSLALSTNSGRCSEKGYVYWANNTQEKHIRSLRDDEKFQLLATAWGEGGKDSEVERKLLDTVSRLIKKINFMEDSEKGRAMDSHFSHFLQVLVNKAIKFNDMRFPERILRLWYGVEEDEHYSCSEEMVWLSPFTNSGARVTFSCRGKESRVDSLRLLNSVTQRGNEFNNTSISVNGMDHIGFHIPDQNRLGVPDSSKSEEFFKAIRDAYFPDEVLGFLREHCEGAKAQVVFPSKPYPLQAVQMRILNNTWPLATSIRRPLCDAKVRKVAVWVGGGSLTEDLEVDALVKIFSSAGVLVDVFDSEYYSVEDFLDVYLEDGYQIIWLVSHGEYDHFDSGAADLQITKSRDFCSIDKLLGVEVQCDQRRLLFLNVCDGATHPGNSLFPRLGFAAALAKKNQAAISHLWPTHGYAAAAFGAIFAIEVIREKSFFDAYKATLSQFIEQPENVVDVVREYVGDCELADRLLRSGYDLSGFYAYGSCAFYE